MRERERYWSFAIVFIFYLSWLVVVAAVVFSFICLSVHSHACSMVGVFVCYTIELAITGTALLCWSFSSSMCKYIWMDVCVCSRIFWTGTHAVTSKCVCIQCILSTIQYTYDTAHWHINRTKLLNQMHKMKVYIFFIALLHTHTHRLTIQFS